MLYILVLLRICFVINPWQDNLTGLGHLYGRRDLLWTASFFNASLIAGSTWLIWKCRPFQDKILMTASMLLCFGASLIPYSPDGSILNDFHVWLNVLGYLAYLMLWLLPVLFYRQKPDFCFWMVILSYVLSLFFFQRTQSITGMGEMIPMLMMIGSFVMFLEGWIGDS